MGDVASKGRLCLARDYQGDDLSAPTVQGAKGQAHTSSAETAWRLTGLENMEVNVWIENVGASQAFRKRPSESGSKNIFRSPEPAKKEANGSKFHQSTLQCASWPKPFDAKGIYRSIPSEQMPVADWSFCWGRFGRSLRMRKERVAKAVAAFTAISHPACKHFRSRNKPRNQA